MDVNVPTETSNSFAAYLLGVHDYEDIAALQRRLVYELGETQGGALILCEHTPILTVGRTGSRAWIAPDDAELHRMGLRTRWVNRGDGCLLHVPGQLTGYVLLHLAGCGLSVQNYADGLHRVLLRTLEEFDLHGTQRDDPPGIFLDHARVATVGVAVTRGIAYHGFSLNVGPFLRAFDILREPGPNGLPLAQTSMEARRQRPAPMPRVRETILRMVEEVFSLSCRQISTGHPGIRREKSSHVHTHNPVR